MWRDRLLVGVNMTSPTTVKPLYVRWIQLTVTDADSVEHDFQCAITQAGLTSTGGDTVSLNTLCPAGTFSENTERAWQLTITAAQDVESADSLMLFLLEHDGESADFLYYPKVDRNGAPVGRGFTGTVTLSPPDNVGNAASGTYATFTATLPLQGKYGMVDDTGAPIPNKASTKPGDVFPAEATISGSDAGNAAKLAGLGYIVDAATVPWASGAKMTVGTYDFHWNQAAVPPAWAAGSHALMMRSNTESKSK